MLPLVPYGSYATFRPDTNAAATTIVFFLLSAARPPPSLTKPFQARMGKTGDFQFPVFYAYLRQNQKRKVHSDRRALLKLGVIENQEKTVRRPSRKRPPASLSTKLDRARKSITDHLEKERKSEDMTPAELSLFKSQLTPLAEIYVQLCNR